MNTWYDACVPAVVPTLTHIAALLVDFPFRARLTLIGGHHQPPGVSAAAQSAQHAGQPPSQTIMQCASSELLAVTWDVADLLAHPQARGVAIRAGQVPTTPRAGVAAAFPGALCSPDDVAALVAPLQAQDHDPLFRRVLADNQNMHAIAQVC
jgi:hypothetical protein